MSTAPAADRRLALVWIGGGVVALVASLVLTIDRFRLLQDPQTDLLCDISPFVACGPVMTSQAGNLFGFPNPLLGIVGFTIVVSTGAAALAGARFARWYWIGLQAGMTLAGVFITWLQVQSIYVIESLCVWCIVVWAVTIPLIVLTTAHALSTGRLGFGQRLGRRMRDYRWTIVALWYLLVAGAIGIAFGERLAALWFG